MGQSCPRRPTPLDLRRAMPPRSVSIEPRSAISSARRWAGSASPTRTEVFEAADPARTMPRWLVIGAIVAVIRWCVDELDQQPLAGAAGSTRTMSRATPQPAPPPAAARRRHPSPAGRAGRHHSNRAGLAPGQPEGRREPLLGHAPAGTDLCGAGDGDAPVLKTGKPEALRITVGSAVAPPVGPPAKTVTNVSLLPAT